jgi:hypothetical protein
MTHPLVDQAVLRCAHGGRVRITASQTLVRIGGSPALVERDLLGCPIVACPHATPTTPPCSRTVGVDEAPSYSGFVRIDGRRLCKATASGTTDWSRLGIVAFGVARPGQTLVRQRE